MKKHVFAFFFMFLSFVYGFSQKQKADIETDPLTYEINKLYPRVNTISYSSDEDILKLDYKNSPYFMLLNGMWNFKWSKNDQGENPITVFNPKYIAEGWQEIPVPGNWELNGFGNILKGEIPFLNTPPSISANNSIIGSYLHEFSIPKEWKGDAIYLHFGGVKSAFNVWINGKHVGYSQDSKTPAEFNITKYILAGEVNKILVVVSAFSAGSFLEVQNALNFSGIERDVFIYSKPLINIYDYKVETSLDKQYKDGNFRLEVTLENNLSGKKEYYVEAELWDDKGQLAKFYKYIPINKGKFEKVEFNEIIESPAKWTAETPNLYTLIIRLKDKKQKELEITGCKVGFKTVEIKNGKFMVNGVAIKIKGVNRPEYSDTMGSVISEDVMLSDIKLMKVNNINTVRTINHPSNSRFYELCNQHGLYVINEANASLYNGSEFKNLAKNNAWEEITVSRIRNMYERDKNHPCIIMWSLGNGESNGICYEEAYKWLKERDNKTPIIFKSAQLHWNTDIHSPTCPNIKDLVDYGSKSQKLPLIFCEYMPITGNSLGRLKDYWNIINQYPQLQGGCIGSWIDQGECKKDNNGNVYWTLGENNDITKAYNMGGLLLPNRIPHPQLAELKNVYKNFHVRPIDLKEGEFEVFNYYDFSNLKDFEFSYKIFSNLKPNVSEGEITINVRPHLSGKFKIMIPKMNAYANEDYFIEFTLRQKQNNSIIPKATILGFCQFDLPMKKLSKSIVSDMDMKEVFTKEDSINILIYTEDIELIFDKKSGLISRFTYHDEKLLNAVPKLNFFRAATNNDYDDDNGYNNWKLNDFGHMQTKINDIKFKRINKKTACITLSLTIKNASNETLFDVFQTYTVYGSGDIFIENRINPSNLIQTLPKVGMQMQLPKEFENAQWFGLDNETYPDRKEAGRIGTYTSKTEDLFNLYLRPQENGNHADTRWISFSTDKNTGIFFDVDHPFNFSVYPYDDENLHEAKHMNELIKKPYFVLNIDRLQAGIGSASCSYDVADKYLIRNEKIAFTIHIKPFHTDNNKPEDFRLTQFEHTENNVLSTPQIKSDRTVFDSTMLITLESNQTDVQIYYTLDGTEPSEKSLLYTKPFTINTSSNVMAKAFKQEASPSFTANAFFNFNYAKSITYEFSPNTPYNKNLELIPFDNLRGKGNNLDNGWIGFSSNDFVATVELVKPINLKSVSVGFAHIPEAWAFLPTEMLVSTSEDGTNFSTAVKVNAPFNSENEKADKPSAVDISATVNASNVRYIKIHAKNLGKMPSWHPVKGLKPWIMMDEISIIERIPSNEK